MLADGRIGAERRAVGTVAAQTIARYGYTPSGQLATLTDANGNLTAYDYDGHGRLIRTRYPSPTSPGVASTTDFEQSGYDANGNLTSLTRRGGGVIQFQYDGLDRLIGRTYPAANVTLRYDLLGRRVATAFQRRSRPRHPPLRPRRAAAQHHRWRAHHQLQPRPGRQPHRPPLARRVHRQPDLGRAEPPQRGPRARRRAAGALRLRHPIGPGDPDP